MADLIPFEENTNPSQELLSPDLEIAWLADKVDFNGFYCNISSTNNFLLIGSSRFRALEAGGNIAGT